MTLAHAELWASQIQFATGFSMRAATQGSAAAVHMKQAGRLHSAKAEALEGDKRAAGIEAEERLPFDDWVVPKSARQHTHNE